MSYYPVFAAFAEFVGLLSGTPILVAPEQVCWFAESEIGGTCIVFRNQDGGPPLSVLYVKECEPVVRLRLARVALRTAAHAMFERAVKVCLN